MEEINNTGSQLRSIQKTILERTTATEFQASYASASLEDGLAKAATRSHASVFVPSDSGAVSAAWPAAVVVPRSKGQDGKTQRQAHKRLVL
jgi:hypothetical protein